MNQEEGQLAEIAFFAKTAKQIEKMREESIQAQAAVRRTKKIAAMREQPSFPKQSIPDSILRNIVIDFLRTKNLNYSYSVFMRECDLLSQEVVLKAELGSILQLRPLMERAPINASIIELLLQKHAQREANRKEVGEMGIQVQLLRVDRSLDNAVLSQVQLSALRREVEEREKKHYQALLSGMKKSLAVSLREQAKKEYEAKMKEMRTEYERQVGILKEKNKEFLVNNPKINPKVEEYLKRVEQLQSQNMALTDSLKQFEKEKIAHNCLKAPKVVQKQRELASLNKDLERKKQEYQFALKTFHTSTEQIAAKKKHAEMPKQTDLFLAELRNKKQSKDYMIDQMYGRMLVMDKRVDALSKDNQALRETNKQLSSKVAQVEQFSNRLKESSAQQVKTEQRMKMVTVKPQSKSISVGVTPDDFNEKKRQHAIDEPSSLSSSSDSELDEQITRKTKFKLKIHQMDAEMMTEKNRLRLFLDDFA